MSVQEEYLQLQVPVFDAYVGMAVLVDHVTNTATIKENLIKGNTQYDYAFVNAKNIVSLEQIYSAYYKVMQDSSYHTMKSRTLHTEFIYALSPFKNIMDCLNKFGISKNSDTLLILKIVKKESAADAFFQSELENIKKIIDGELIPLCDENLQKTADIGTISKNYKLKLDSSQLKNDYGIVTRHLVALTQLKGL